MAAKPIVLLDDRYAPRDTAATSSTPAAAPGTITLKEEGNSLGAVSSLNVIGIGITASATAGAGTVTLASSSTPAATTIPVGDSNGRLASGWGGGASTLATLDANSRVPTAQLGTGTADAFRVLYGDGAWSFPEVRRLILQTNSVSV